MPQETKKCNLILIYGDFNFITKICRKNSIFRTYSWLFLSKDTILHTRIREFFQNQVKFIQFGDDLQQIAHHYRQKYIDAIGEMSLRQNSLMWWVTSVSEKNLFISNILLNFCYMKVTERNIGSDENIVIVCGSRSLMYSIRDQFSGRNEISVQIIYSKKGMILERFFDIIKCAARKSFFVFKFACRIILAKIYGMIKGHDIAKDRFPAIAIHTWTDGRSFGGDKDYKDVYFGSLMQRLTEQEKDYFFISNVLPTIFYPKAVRMITKSREKIYLFEEFLTFADIVRSITHVMFKFPRIEKIPLVDNINISHLIYDEMRVDRVLSSRSENSLLYFFAGQRLAKGKNIRALIFPFENHMWEKMLCMGIHHNESDMILIGYAHSIVSPMYLNYTISSDEQAVCPIPDIIMVNGSRAMNVLRESGFTKTRIVICGAFRFEYLTRKREYGIKKHSEINILVVPTAGVNETLELLDKIILAYAGREGTKVYIKLHPNLPISKISQYLPAFPDNIQICERPIDALLTISDLVIYTESAVSIEALSNHIPVLHINSDFRIDMDIFNESDRIKSALTSEEILRVSSFLIKGDLDSAIDYNSIVNEYFSSVDDQILIDILD
jgi:hypothetical protein